MKSERGQGEIAVIVVLAVILAAIVACAFGLGSTECSNKAEIMGFNSRYDIISGCFYEVEEGRWIDSDAYYYEGQPRN